MDSRADIQKDDDPPHSRLFVIGGKSVSETELRDIFSDFGKIEYVSVKRDRETNQPKGFSYIKFSKTSSAAKALEEMNGKVIGTDPRPIKVVIAASNRDGIRVSGHDEDITATRLFIVVPKSMEKEEIRDVFSAYGDVEHVSIVYGKGTGESRGLAYVNYHKFSDAARAFEECDNSYRAKFAESKNSMVKRRQQQQQHSDPTADFRLEGGGGMAGRLGGSSAAGLAAAAHVGGNSSSSGGPMMNMIQSGGGGNGCCRLKVLFNPAVSKEMFRSLFNIVPGLVSCDLTDMTPDGAISTVIYNNPQSAAHAQERIHGFEYPTGFRLQVRQDDPFAGSSRGFDFGSMSMSSSSTPTNNQSLGEIPSQIQSLISNIQQATEALKSSGYGNLVGVGGGGGGVGKFSADIEPMTAGRGGGSVGFDAERLCSAKLPARQDLLPANTKCQERLFFVLRDARECPDPNLVTDLFCRFGDLIDAHCMRGKKCGYARYGSRQSAAKALSTLNNEDFLGSRLVIEIADDERRANKRTRTD